MDLPRSRRGRRALETRVRQACLRVECPDHGTRPDDIVFTWTDNRLEIRVEPLPCCKRQDDAICAVFASTIGGQLAP
jgi:hypothetical protein